MRQQVAEQPAGLQRGIEYADVALQVGDQSCYGGHESKKTNDPGRVIGERVRPKICQGEQKKKQGQQKSGQTQQPEKRVGGI